MFSTVSAGQAATCQFGDQSMFTLAADVWTSTACVGQVQGNDSDQSGGKGIVNVNSYNSSGMFGIGNWTLDSRYDSNGSYNPSGLLTISNVSSNLMMGDWSVSSWSGIGSAMLVIKGANGFAAYLLDLTAGLVGQWSTQALTNRGGNQPVVSHISLYVTPAPVPVPAAGLLMIGGLGALAAVRRRRRAA